MRLMMLILCAMLFACGGAPTTTGGGGEAGASSSSSEAGTGGTGGAGLTTWTDGLKLCGLAAPLVTTAYTTGAQALLPPAGHVTMLHWAVAKDDGTGKEPATGGPYVFFFGVGPHGAPGSLEIPVTLSGYGETTLEEGDITFGLGGNPHVGIANIPVNLPLAEGEVLWIGGRFDRPGSPSASLVVCKQPVAGGEDSYAATGACPGPSCVTAAGASGPITNVWWTWADGISDL